LPGNSKRCDVSSNYRSTPEYRDSQNEVSRTTLNSGSEIETKLTALLHWMYRCQVGSIADVVVTS